jgi:serine/threonine protein kinase
MSAVYKAMDPNLKRVVAVKMIHPHLSADPDFVQRFEEEASAVAQLRHSRIIQVYDFNQDEGVYYMVLEFVPGENFQDYLRRLNEDGRRLTVAQGVEYMADICDAVDYAHRRGMIHRDIKPANIMLNLTGEAILMDFGIAKIVGSQRHTATGAVVGTAMYMSPEQIKGERPDRRSDIYSLGVTLFEMVSGRPPFKADSAMTLMMMHINDPVPDPRKLNPDVPDALVAIINKALAKDPSDRFQTGAEMASALRSVLSDLKSGVARVYPPAATMVEELPRHSVSPEATSLESPPSVPEGTVVESGSRSAVGTSKREAAVEGTALESPMKSAPLPVDPSGGGYVPAGPAAESVVAKPQPASQPRESAPKKTALSMPVIAGIGVGLACLIFGGLFLVNRLLSQGEPPATEPPAAVLLESTPTSTATEVQAVAPVPTDTLAVTQPPTDTPPPSATPTPETPYVNITDIRVEGNLYIVDYVVHNFPDEDNLHVHIFFDSVAPEQAGSPGAGPWKLTWGTYGDPPFTQYGIANRPPDATQMCALVANPNHSIQPNSGNCVDLP